MIAGYIAFREAGSRPYRGIAFEELQQPRSRQLLSNDDAALSIDAVHLKHRLRDVQTNRGYLCREAELQTIRSRCEDARRMC